MRAQLINEVHGLYLSVRFGALVLACLAPILTGPFHKSEEYGQGNVVRIVPWTQGDPIYVIQVSISLSAGSTSRTGSTHRPHLSRRRDVGRCNVEVDYLTLLGHGSRRRSLLTANVQL